jgi:sugar phosphate isomerase/epimerase
MQSSFNRRRFLATSGAALAASAIYRGSANAAPAQPKPDDADATAPLFDISLAQWSLHRKLKSGNMDNLDFAKAAKEEFGIDGIEYVNQFFKDKAGDQGYLGQMKQRAADLGVKSLLIMIDGEGALGDADEAKRAAAVEKHFKWVDAAKFLGCHSIRVNAASSGSYDEQVGRAADGLAKLSEFAAKSGINVIVENHGGLSSNGQWLAQVIRKVAMDNCGTLPDFGNFTINRGGNGTAPIVYDRYLGMASLMPFAKAVSAKSHDFDADGNETETDFEKMLNIMLDAGYRGYVGIEYEGRELSESDGILATKKLLERCREKLAAAR